ncbi:MAG: hypothetical protein ACK5EU_02455 [Pseudanabaena sp.]
MMRKNAIGYWVLRVRSLFDVGNRRSGFVGDEGRSLFDLRE